MATKEELQQKLIAKLKELFQLDQPDLDFGFYRVMHVKQKEISDYLENKLPSAIAAAFKDSSGAVVAEKEAAYHAAVAQAQSFGAPDPEATEPVKRAKAAWEEAKNGAGAEADVYDHLYHFFERYYDKGDFVSLRYLTRETDRKAKPYAIPYAGEEVMLHWANSDQYYIKTSENFSHYSFDLTKFAAFEKMNEMERMAAQVPSDPLKVHFEVVDAEEGEHGNVKTGKDRFFVLHDGTSCALEADGLHIFFEYREDPNMTGQVAKWQEKLRSDAFESLKSLVPDIGKAMGKMLDCPPPNSERLPDYVRLLFMELERTKSDGKKEKYTPLAAYLKRYMARNTADYFIHKDLGGFLRRELDFYIKNDLMVLDNVVSATPESVAKWLGTLKVFRKIAEDIITFLAQLEDFQKKLWLKKKFIVQCDYCITMDRVPDALKPEVLANQKQLDAWKALSTDVDPKTEDMTAIDARMVDTQYFDDVFKQKLLASIDNFDEQCDGALIHGENFGALTVVQSRLRELIKAIFIDPPYNTGEDGFPYKDKYQSSSWLSMMNDRLRLSMPLMGVRGLLACHMDEHEHTNLDILLGNLFGINNLGPLVWDKRNPKGDAGGIAVQHEYVHFASARNKEWLKQEEDSFVRDKPDAEIMLKKAAALIKKYKGVTNAVRSEFGEWVAKSDFTNGEKAYHFIDDNGDVYRPVSMAWPNKQKAPPEYFIPLKHPVSGKDCPVPLRGWRNPPERMKELQDRGLILFGEDETTQPQRKYLLKENLTENVSSLYYMGGSDDQLFKDLDLQFENPKTVKGTSYFLKAIARPKDSLVLDYFAGSGTTAHAVIDLNRQDGGKRKYILIEMGDHFDTVLMPRVQKVVYSPDWKDGKPTTNAKGISHCFKYFRLESYEDALNNLQVDSEKGAAFAGIGDYFFKYMLDVETKGSPSLLNIEQFSNPFGYKLIIKKPGSEEREERTVDLVETFNYLIGLRIEHTAATVGYNAEFERAVDPELPTDAHTKLTIKGKIKLDEAGPWKFRTVEGWCPKNRATPNDGAKERVLIVWRTLTGDSEKDNAVLNAFLQRKDVNALDGEFDVIYVNGSNNVPNLKKENDVWKVRLIEEDFRARMWEGA